MHTLGISFVNDFFDKDAPDPNKRDRNLIINYLHIEGPLDGPVTKLPESHEKLINAVPDGKLSPRKLPKKSSSPGESRFRRPATDKEIERLVSLTEKARLRRNVRARHSVSSTGGADLSSLYLQGGVRPAR